MLTNLIMTALLALQTPAMEWGERAWSSAVDSLRKGEDWGHHYEAEKASCPACGEGFQVASVGTYTTSGKDLDFKTRDYVSANPYLFWLWMCPKCNYCAYSNGFDEPLDDEGREKVSKALGPPTKFESYFDIPFSVLLRRAEQCMKVRGASDDDMAWLFLYGAWMARDSEQPEAEKEYHRRARERFEIVAEKGEGNDRAAAAYLVAEIHRRHGDVGKAKPWLDKAEKIAAEVASKNIPDWVKRCREEIEAGEKREPPEKK